MNKTGLNAWVPLCEAATAEEASMIKGVLEYARIPVVLDHEALGDAFSMSTGMPGDITVKVPKDLAGKAAQILQTKRIGARYEG